MTTTGAWRLSYTPGSWLLLAGPTSVVILQPASPQWSELVTNIWEDVLASASIHDLASRMSAFSLDAMPSFGAFFWTPDGMRSLIRGGVVAIDQRTGTTVADGRGVLTWREVGLGHLEQVRVDLGPRPGTPELVLPLVVGVASAGSVLLDSSGAARVPLEQGAYDPGAADPAAHLSASGSAALEPEVSEPAPTGPVSPPPAADPFAADVADDQADADDDLDAHTARALDSDQDDSDHADADRDESDGRLSDGVDEEGAAADSDDDDDDDWEDTQFDLPVVPADPSIPIPVTGPVGRSVVPADGPETAPDLGATTAADLPAAEESEDARTVFASSLPGAPGPGPVPPPAPAAPTRPVLAVLRVSTGGRADVDRPVLIGRSPIASRVKGDQLPRLLTVPSPSHDISRTHLEVAPQDGRVVVTDLHSTNGTVLVRPGSKPVELEPGTPTPLEAGSLIDLGDGVTIAVDRT